MTAKDLIELLHGFDPDTPVVAYDEYDYRLIGGAEKIRVRKNDTKELADVVWLSYDCSQADFEDP